MLRKPALFLSFAIVLSACREGNLNNTTPVTTASTTGTNDAIPSNTDTTTDGTTDTTGTTTDTTSDVTDGSDSTSNVTATDSSGTNTSSTDSGAAMNAATESVTVTKFDTGIAGNAGNSTLQVQRANGEIWQFNLTVTPNTQVGATFIFHDSQQIFGDPAAGTLIFPDGSTLPLSSSSRLQ